MSNKFQKIAAHALIKKGDKYLFTKRAPVNDYKPNEWDLPGGTIEFKEEPVEALLKEVLEETSLKVKIEKPVFICSHTQGERHQFWIVYECECLDGKVKLNPEEHDKFIWLSKSEISKLPMIYFLQKFYNDILSK
jgi:8-oxo-dGTP pyrophosphatase MutT (NUDIX family)